MAAVDYPRGLPVGIGPIKLFQDRWGAEIADYREEPDGSIVVDVDFPRASVAKLLGEFLSRAGLIVLLLLRGRR